jgi:hypothetical protein
MIAHSSITPNDADKLTAMIEQTLLAYREASRMTGAHSEMTRS